MGREIGIVFVLALATALSFMSTAVAQDYPSLSTPPQMEQTGSNDAAVIVGIENYAFVSDVDGVRETVNDWETFLVRGLGISATRVHTLVDSRATRERMLTFAQRAAEDVGEGGTLWFVFIGHGAPTSDGEDGVLVGVDAQSEPASLEGRGLRRSELVRALEQGEQAQTMVVIDACFSGQTSEGSALAEGMQPLVPDRADEAFRPQASTMVMAAAESDQFAGALPGMQRPAFSYVLLGALRGWASTGDAVTASDVLQYTRQHLRLLDHDQTPAFLGDDGAVLVRGATEEEPQLAGVIRAALRGPAPESPQVVEDPADDFAVLNVVDVSPTPLSVYVDDREVGVAPGQAEIPADRTVTVRLRATGYESWETELEVAAGEMETVRGIQLQPRPTQLSVTANVHGAEIVVDGEVVGTTRLNRSTEVEAPSGQHTVAVRMEGYRTHSEEQLLVPGGRAQMEVELVAGEDAEGYVEIPAGTFMQGSPESEEGRDDHEGPQREVEITRSFLLKETPVTQGEWEELMGNNPSYFSSCGEDCPVERVNYYEAVVYVNRLSQREGLEQCYEVSGCSGGWLRDAMVRRFARGGFSVSPWNSKGWTARAIGCRRRRSGSTRPGRGRRELTTEAWMPLHGMVETRTTVRTLCEGRGRTTGDSTI